MKISTAVYKKSTISNKAVSSAEDSPIFAASMFVGIYAARDAEAKRKKTHTLQAATQKHRSEAASQTYFSIIKVVP